MQNVFSESSKIYGNGRTFSSEGSLFFVIDFLSENVEIYQEHEIEKEGLIIDFQDFSNTKETHKLDKKK